MNVTECNGIQSNTYETTTNIPVTETDRISSNTYVATTEISVTETGGIKPKTYEITHPSSEEMDEETTHIIPIETLSSVNKRPHFKKLHKMEVPCRSGIKIQE